MLYTVQAYKVITAAKVDELPTVGKTDLSILVHQPEAFENGGYNNKRAVQGNGEHRRSEAVCLS
jgi:hypothetical protein